MKKLRKFTAMVTAIALAGCMMTSMSMLNASAEGETYSITITQSQDNATHIYEAYQVFKGDYANGVLSNITWGDGVNQSGLLEAIKAINVGTTENADKPFATCTSASEVADVLSGLQTAINEANAGSDETAKANATTKKETVLKAFANAIAPFLNDDNKVKGSEDIGKTKYTIDVSAKGAGYYLVQDGNSMTSTGQMDGSKTRYMLQVIGDTSASATAKNSSPSVIKKVKENVKEVNKNGTDKDGVFIVDEQYNDVADYNIGDTVPFKLYGSMPSTLDDYEHYYYEFQDTLDTQFTVVDSDSDDKVDVVVKVDGTVVNSNGYTIENPDTGETCTFKVVINDVKNLTNETGTSIAVTKDSIITVEYNAVLNTNAVIGLNGQENAVKLVYSNNPNNTGDGSTKPTDTGETPDDKVIVFTYELDITKVDGATLTGEGKTDTNTEYLKDAEFLLYEADASGNKTDTLVTIYKNKTTGDYVIGEQTDTSNWEKVNTDTDGSRLVTVTEGEKKGKIVIKGLDDGIYYLEEAKAPDGYNELEGYIKLTISATTKNDQEWDGQPSSALTDISLIDKDNKNIDVTADENKGIVEALIANNKGSSLPSTGGIGTTIFYTVGGVLVVGAGIGLIAKKRAKNEQ